MDEYLNSALMRFQYYKTLGEQTFDQMDDPGLFWQCNAESNSIAMIVQHLAGNMISRWTDFLTSDGEKPWRNRDTEFETVVKTRAELMQKWNDGWQCLVKALHSITNDDWQKEVYIRGERHTVVDAINRQLSHYPYHIGQIVFIGKIIAGEKWNSLSIPREQSETFNAEKVEKNTGKANL